MNQPDSVTGLQWRAGQSSGQTCLVWDTIGTQYGPSMEGRTIVRPDHPLLRPTKKPRPPFNGGPDNRPARPAARESVDIDPFTLQWRAGQSSGQTPRTYTTRIRDPDIALQWRAGQSSGQTLCRGGLLMTDAALQWRAGQSSGQTSATGIRLAELSFPSMEGRTIVRPDLLTVR